MIQTHSRPQLFRRKDSNRNRLRHETRSSKRHWYFFEKTKKVFAIIIKKYTFALSFFEAGKIM